MGYGGFGVWRGHVSPQYSIGDDLSWTHGKHAFKGGFEFRNTLSSGFGDPNFTPLATLGAGSNPVNGLDGTVYTGLNATPAAAARNITDRPFGLHRYDQPGFRSGERPESCLGRLPDHPI